MQFNITFQEFNTEKIQKGRNFYEKGVVTYTNSKGENKTQNIMSFANPELFAIFKKAAQGTNFRVETAKNDAGYENWAKAVSEHETATPKVAGNSFSVGSGSTPVRTTYETPEERKQRQLYIIKQSSISSAIETLSVGAKSVDPDKVLELAQKYVDFVYEVPQLTGAGTETMVFHNMPWQDNPETGV